MHEIIRVSYLIVCPMNFNLLCDASREAGVLKLSKNAKFQVFVDVCILFSNFLVRLRSGLGFSCKKS